MPADRWLLQDMSPLLMGSLVPLIEQRGGIAVRARTDGAEAPPGPVAVCLLEITDDEAVALKRVRAVRQARPSVPLVAIGSGLSVEVAVRTLRTGANDVITTAISPPDIIQRTAALICTRPEPDALERLVGSGPLHALLRSEIRDFARMHSTVLVTGETGTGKGLIARLLHQMSERSQGPFVHVDCAALSPSVIESELFGHERGAFTGAVQRRQGRFELAATGTIFLDEIGNLELGLQSKLLRVLQDREYERIGGAETLRMEARVIAATSTNLETAIAKGTFRPDLFYRLNVIRIHVPALRDRREDVPQLCADAARRVSPPGKMPVRFSREAERLLMDYDWPGNVRELMNIVERLAIRVQGEVQSEDVQYVLKASHPVSLPRPEVLVRPAALPGGADSRSYADPQVFGEILTETGGNIARAARRLRVARSTLCYWISQYRLEGLIPKD